MSRKSRLAASMDLRRAGQPSRLIASTFHALLITGLLALPRPASAANAAVATQPVGLINLQAAAGTTALALPVESTPAFVGTVFTVGKRNLAWTGKGWPQLSAASYQTTPYAMRFTSGRGAGLAFVILSAGTNNARLDTAADLTGQIVKGDQFEILPADTLASVFGADGGGLATSPDPAKADQVRLLKNGQWQTYYHTGQHWALQGDASRASRNLVVIPPGEGFLLVRHAATPWSLQVTGDVPLAPAIRLPRGVSRALLGDPFSATRRLADLGLPGPQNGYSVGIYGPAALRTFIYRGGNWKTPGTTGTPLGPRIAVGSAILVERATQ